MQVGFSASLPAADLPLLAPQNLVGQRAWPIRDQGSLPMCTAYATVACLELFLAGDGDIPAYSDSFIYYFTAQHAKAAIKNAGTPVFDGYMNGHTRFEDAKAALEQYSCCTLPKWPDDRQGEPSAGAQQDALQHKLPRVDVQSYLPGTPRVSGLARKVYDELVNERPVGVGMPAYRQRGNPGANNWTAAWTDGRVLMPQADDDVDMESGHAVCVVGYSMPDGPVAAVEDGYFLFRNSFGSHFASAPKDDEPQGYGLLPARLVEEACWSLLFVQS